jgi:hypothetical protein
MMTSNFVGRRQKSFLVYLPLVLAMSGHLLVLFSRYASIFYAFHSLTVFSALYLGNVVQSTLQKYFSGCRSRTRD